MQDSFLRKKSFFHGNLSFSLVFKFLVSKFRVNFEMSLRKFSSVSSKYNMTYLGNKENFHKVSQMVKLFHFVVHSGLVSSIDNFMSCQTFQIYICSRHSKGGIAIDFPFQLCNNSFNWNQNFKKIFGCWVLLKFDLENHKHNTKVLII